MPDIRIAPLDVSPQVCGALGELLIETVANGGSVSFMHPPSPEAADRFWRIRWLRPTGRADRSRRL